MHNAVALLRETLNAFLQSVGEELAEVDSPSISPEDVVRAIGSIDCGGDSPEGSNPTGGAGALVLEEIVSRARDLLVLQAEQQRREEGEKAADCDGNVRPPGGPRTDAGAAPGKKTRKRKPKRPRITAEMEAEQERLLKASKRALDEAQGGGRDAFRVELS
ncbi:unnamed protein product [Pseudo-nitzschia multistriata]|uniref:Uncharacterized protein n=1 Tax=Pseudo-nitzschia multistriata TaxID=183589 RepID=A0A448YZA4_9STRA|nr:unnamed protein product [Pseudo-nitzschia multistriata]